VFSYPPSSNLGDGLVCSSTDDIGIRKAGTGLVHPVKECPLMSEDTIEKDVNQDDIDFADTSYSDYPYSDYPVEVLAEELIKVLEAEKREIESSRKGLDAEKRASGNRSDTQPYETKSQ